MSESYDASRLDTKIDYEDRSRTSPKVNGKEQIYPFNVADVQGFTVIPNRIYTRVVIS
jgi:hypothetical protein